MPGRAAALSLRQRLLLTILTPLMVVLTISVLFDYRLAKGTADVAFDQGLADAALDIASHIKAGDSKLSVELSAEAEALLRSDASDKIYFAVRDGAGRLLAGDADLPVLPLASADERDFRDSRFRGDPVRAVVQRTDAPLREITVTVAETRTKRDHASRRILTAMIMPNLIVILATFAAVYLGVRKGLAPLAEVEREIAKRSPRDLRRIAAEATPREVRPMLARLNELFGLLRSASEAQQRFLADAAHQLRTPLAGLQTQIELATLEGRFASDPERRARIEDATGRIGHLVDQLLTHARADPAAAAAQSFAAVSLDALVEKAASSFLDSALAKNIDLGFEIEAAGVEGIAWMLREALANMIDNALRYTPADGVVTVRSGMRGGCGFLEVEDNGPGIAQAERVRVFERFYRVPGSAGPGCGLGLAIVREIVELHQGRIELADVAGGGLRMTLMFQATVDRTQLLADTGRVPFATG
jgi:two-component system, OmpR family, sensor histidine kinase TctE